MSLVPITSLQQILGPVIKKVFWFSVSVSRLSRRFEDLKSTSSTFWKISEKKISTSLFINIIYLRMKIAIIIIIPTCRFQSLF